MAHDNADHYTEVRKHAFPSSLVEVWCPNIDEEKLIVGDSYVRHCPMCGESIEV